MTTKYQTRESVFAVTKEVTEAVPVVPTGGTDFIAFQEGFTIEPAFTELTNDELQASIGRTKPALGFEEPSASFSHYFRHSGTEGTAPNFGYFIESALGTAAAANGTERLTASGSTTTDLELQSGGTDFARGKAVLVKNSADGYEIRNIASVDTNTLTLAQSLNNAPASGYGCGKCVHYAVADTGHPTLSLWGYRANGGAVELISGARVTEMSVDVTAGEYINGSFTMSGIKYYFDPITITSSNKYLDFDEGGSELTVTMAEKTYKDPYDLAVDLQTEMNGLATAAITVSYSDSTGKFTITSDGGTFQLLWNSGTNTANSIASTIGFSTAADSTGAVTYTSATAQSWAAAYTPSYDSADPLVAKSNQVMLGLSDEVTCFEASTLSISLANTKSDIMSICADSGKSGSLISAREVDVTITGYLTQYQAKEFNRFRNNTEVLFTFNCGEKSGSNWVAGKCVNFHIPTAKIGTFTLGDSDGIVTLEMTLNAYVSSSQGEFFINFL